MTLNVFKTGHRVIDLDGRISLVISQMHWRPESDLVLVQLDNTTRTELLPSKQLELLPTDEQYPAHGGQHPMKNA